MPTTYTNNDNGAMVGQNLSNLDAVIGYLIIASSFSGTLPHIYLRQHIAPFRDTNQTSMNVGTLVATTRMEKDKTLFRE